MVKKRKDYHQRYHLTPVQMILFFYSLSILLSTILLSLPISQQEGVDTTFIDILFTAVSALSVTGLTPISISETFSPLGIIFIAIMLQIGAVGIMAIGTFIWLLLGKKIGIQERQLIVTDQNQISFGGVVRLMKQIIYVFIIFELISFLILGTYFLNYFPTAKEAYFHGFFATISAISNGGFDLTGKSLIPFQNDYFVQMMHMLLIVIGAIGFPVLIEVKEFLFTKRDKRKQFQFSLFTKLTTTTFFTLIILGTLLIFVLDFQGYFAHMSWHKTFFQALFQSVTTRSGGLSTLPIHELSDENHLFMSLLMFIGASPSSAGGGIRTTTFALMVIFIITYAQGGKSIKLFKREVYEEDLMKAITVILMAIALVFSSTLVLSMIEPFNLQQILFEVTSAFGTVGLSLGITSELTVLSKTILMLLMFIGRVGIITFLFSFQSKNKNGNYRYPKERIIIG